MNSISVVIVEDDCRISKVHAKFLEDIENFELIGVANTINDGKYMVETLQPDLILLDLFFPEGNGMELLYDLRREHSRVDVILITAAKDMDSLNAALKGGVFDYIIKPVFINRFKEALGNYYNHKQKIKNVRKVDQEFVDQILKGRSTGTAAVDLQDVPKGIDPITLKDVVAAFAGCSGDGVSAAEIGKVTGLARTTARKYFEYLLSIGQLQIKLEYGTIGRPERKYIRASV
jgi:response regulator of citrate/malate metabolism